MDYDEQWPVAVGDEVITWAGGRTGSSGIVKIAGPKIIHVADVYDNGKVSSHITKFRRDTRQRYDGYPGYFQTKDQHRDGANRTRLRTQLREWGVEVTPAPLHGSPNIWTTERIERLAVFVQALLTQELSASDGPPQLTDPVVGMCSGCGRKTWSPAEIGNECNMTQPTGERCPGLFCAHEGGAT